MSDPIAHCYTTSKPENPSPSQPIPSPPHNNFHTFSTPQLQSIQAKLKTSQPLKVCERFESSFDLTNKKADAELYPRLPTLSSNLWQMAPGEGESASRYHRAALGRHLQYRGLLVETTTRVQL